MTPDSRRWLTPKQYADVFNLGLRTVYRLHKAGRLTSFSINRDLRILNSPPKKTKSRPVR